METDIYKQIELENEHTLVIFDKSRKISEDAFLVLVKAEIEIKIKKDLFSDPVFSDQQITDEKLSQIQAVLGETVVYQYAAERNFIMAEDKDAVFESLLGTFLGNLGPYIKKPQFPGKFVLKKYKDKKK